MFRKWERDPVTIAFREALKKSKEELKEALTNPDMIMNNQKGMIHILGSLEALDFALEIRVDQQEIIDEDSTER